MRSRRWSSRDRRLPSPSRWPRSRWPCRARSALPGRHRRRQARVVPRALLLLSRSARWPSGCGRGWTRTSSRWPMLAGSRGPGSGAAGPSTRERAGGRPDRRPRARRVRRDGLRPRGRAAPAARASIAPPRSGPSSRRSRSPGRWGRTCPARCASSPADPGARQLRTLAATWQVAHDTGSGLAAAIGQAAEAIRADRRTARLVAAELAAAHATARMLAVLPVGVLLLGTGIGGDPVGFLTGSTAGLVCLAAGPGTLVRRPALARADRRPRAAPMSGRHVLAGGGPGGASPSPCSCGHVSGCVPARRTAAPRVPTGRRRRRCCVRLRPLLALVGLRRGLGDVRRSARAGSAALPRAVAVWVVLGRTEDPSVVRRRERLLEDLPTGVDLLASCLDAGSAPESALVDGEPGSRRSGGGGVPRDPPPARGRRRSRDRSGGRSPGTTSSGPLGRAVGRAHETGAPVGRAVHQLADELRERARADVEARARSIEVKAAAPLGLCLLPGVRGARRGAAGGRRLRRDAALPGDQHASTGRRSRPGSPPSAKT